ncbi:restriction endonuclease subunit S [Nannocystis pusilla]|uniref:restriction endonuclease subunit S n=1 Tax=Nannocystis pusilla TaxID=889268 RepID=UPI003BF23A70
MVEHAALREILAFTRDGEWGQAVAGPDLVEMRVIRGTDFADIRVGDCSRVPTRFIPLAQAERKRLQPQDILIETAGGTKDQPTGRTVLISSERLEAFGIPVTCASFARILRVDPTRACPRYVFWWLQNLYLAGEMERHQVQHTGVARFQYTRFAETALVPLPERRSQEQIADLLGSLDAKIELNRQTNETLETMARALFKSWFVDFDPIYTMNATRCRSSVDNEGAASSLRFTTAATSKLPSGWSLRTVRQICGVITSGGTPSTSNADFWGGGIPWLASGETRAGFVTRTEKTITPAAVDNSSTRFVRAGATVIAGAGQGKTRGQTSLLLIDVYVNQSVVALTADHTCVSDLYLFFELSRRYEEFRSISDSHSSRGSLTTALLGALPIVVPPLSLVHQFDAVVSPMIERIHSNLQENETLVELRNQLLPRLLSGELRKRDAERVVEATV